MNLHRHVTLTLRTKIFLITTVIILLIQGMNSVLEIGFLYRNLEQSSLKKYQVIGKEIARKLETSLLFGKPLDQLDFKRLLDGMIPKGIDNFAVMDTAGKHLFTLSGAALAAPAPEGASVKVQKTQGQYLITLALTKQEAVLGHIALWIPMAGVQDKLAALIRSSLLNSLIIIAILLPLLYVVLTLRVETPFKKSIQRMRRSLMDRDSRRLLDGGINPRGLIEAEKWIDRLRQGDWLNQDNARVYEKLEAFLEMGKAVLGGDPADPSGMTGGRAVDRQRLAGIVQETQALLDEQKLYREMFEHWRDLQARTMEPANEPDTASMA